MSECIRHDYKEQLFTDTFSIFGENINIAIETERCLLCGHYLLPDSAAKDVTIEIIKRKRKK